MFTDSMQSGCLSQRQPCVRLQQIYHDMYIISHSKSTLGNGRSVSLHLHRIQHDMVALHAEPSVEWTTSLNDSAAKFYLKTILIDQVTDLYILITTDQSTSQKLALVSAYGYCQEVTS